MTQDRPNIILIMCDDLGYGDTGFNGHPIIATPHLDALRNEGIRFTRFFAGGPVCSPTRGTCLTGRHYARYGITHANVGHLPQQELTLARLTKGLGYTTGHFGKWHLGTLDRSYSGKSNRNPASNFAPPWERDYDVSFATEYAVPTWDPGRHFDGHSLARTDEPWSSPYYANGKKVEEMLLGCDSAHIVDRAVPFIRNAVGQNRPFFTTIWFHAPHGPVEAGPEFLAMYPDCAPDEAHYYGVVTAMDRQVGRINQLVKDLGVENNTMIWFCSDNGPEGDTDLSANRRYRGSTGGLRGRKRSLFNGGIGVPALVKWPGIAPPGAELTAPCSTLDYFPTIAAALAHQMPDERPLDGLDLMPLLRAQLDTRPVPIPYRFLATKDSMFGAPTLALLDNQFKFLTNLSAQGAEDLLFDLDADRAETTNIIAHNRHRAQQMRQFLSDFMASCRKSHLGSDYPQPHEPIGDFQEITGTWSAKRS
ncbi:MAG: sulfatase-like hydrolase/transferase [Candidatus Latescibacteria bacterium]|nr:sulfatase-like hydrolase/transferase [Candidatus Latescibacterota bacterium]